MPARIKLHPSDGSETGQYPHNSLTCNVIEGAQMIIVGGTFPLSEKCDVPEQFGAHNLDMGLQNPDEAPWKTFVPNLTTYAVPTPIISAVGGSAGGGATKTTPVGGFNNPDLETLMTRKASIAKRTPTRAIPDPTNAAGGNGEKRLSNGAIAGIATGGAVALIVALACCVWFIRNHRRRRPQPSGSNEQPPPGASLGVPPDTPTNDGPWSPYSADHTLSLTPSSPQAGSPFLQQPSKSSGGGLFIAQPPAELDAQSQSPSAGSQCWQGADGVMREPVSPGQLVSSGGAVTCNTPGGSGSPWTKVDSSGQVWVPVSLSGLGFNPESGPGAGSGSGACIHSSGTDDGRPPQEQLSGWAVHITGTGNTGLNAAQRMPRHQTYYHP